MHTAQDRSGMISLGAEVVVAGSPGYDDTEELAQEEARRSCRPFISGSDDFDVMAANGGTLAMELLEDLPQVSHFIFPVGGGGLGAGLALYTRDKIPDARLVGCQLEASPTFKVSLAQAEPLHGCLLSRLFLGASRAGSASRRSKSSALAWTTSYL